ncbi:hypothetical protein A0128_03875 [Leptospira tipperaryensis]|uniref:Uncharacterized protein n=1 Tax=Leptospira tipperaryensis TaxID=2564040 RepID=A0A1D7UU46_9LEPT|nr:hypothetical protein A0128_03875 [Leptospira tipperaryensis]
MKNGCWSKKENRKTHRILQLLSLITSLFISKMEFIFTMTFPEEAIIKKSLPSLEFIEFYLRNV